MMAETLAAAASEAANEHEATALLGAAVIGGLSARDRRALRRVQGHLVAASAILARVMRRRRLAPGVRVIPTITRLTAQTLARRAATGRPITPGVAAQVMAVHTQRVLGNPRLCGLALRRNIGATRRARRAYAIRSLPRSRNPRY
jgi:hypothetical protein